MPSILFIDEKANFNVSSENIESPLYFYSAKLPGAEEFIEVENPYQPETAGEYIFKVEVAETDTPDEILATDERTVVVKEIPEPITVKGKVPAAWTSTISIYNWNDYTDGNFVTAVLEEGWYSYTFERMDMINVIFVNGTTWTDNKSFQTVDIENITESTCYEVGAVATPNDEDYGKRTVKVADCSDSDLTPVVSLTVSEIIFLDEEIVFEAVSRNITDPIYTYTVKIPESTEFVEAASPYQPEIIGIYTFKVEAAESNAPDDILAESEVNVNVKEVPAPIIIKVKVPAEWDSAISFYNWNEYTGGNFVTAVADNGWYTHAFERMDTVNIVFVNGTEWATEDNSQQTVDIKNITSSTCYQVGDIAYPEDENYGKRTVAVIDCSGTSTSIVETDNTISINIENNTIHAFFDGMAFINLYSLTGQLIHSEYAGHQFTYTTSSGIYFLRINGKSYKIIVR